MRQLIATTKEGSETNKSLATGKKGLVTTERSLATIKEGLLTNNESLATTRKSGTTT